MEKTKLISLPYGEDLLSFSVPERNLLAVASPNPTAACGDDLQELRRALAHPIGAPRLSEAARGARKVVIVADDMTRQTPVELMIPALLDEFNLAGVNDAQITVVIALGTHRRMTPEEIADHVGPEVINRVCVMNNPWWDSHALVDLGLTSNNTPISISRVVMEADFVVGVGSIVPHHIPGFSGGAKIIQPGVTGPETTGATHFLSTRAAQCYLGKVENAVRDEMEAIAARAGLKSIFNVVLDPGGKLVEAFYGHPVLAHRAGVAVSRHVYGVSLHSRADIVIAGSHPCDIEFWQAHKSLYPAEMAVKAEGTIIVVTPSPEGVSVTHQDMLQITALDAQEIERLILQGEIRDVVSGALALAWAKTRQHAAVSLVSGGISPEEARALGFAPYLAIEDALRAAFLKHGPDATVTVLTHAPDMLPLLPE